VTLDDQVKSSLSFDFKLEVLALPELDVTEFTTNNAPYFEVTPSDKTLFFLEALDYNLGVPYDPEGDEVTVEWTLTSKGERIITTDEETVTIRASDSTPEFVGVYPVKVKLTDDNTDSGSLSTEYEFFINL